MYQAALDIGSEQREGEIRDELDPDRRSEPTPTRTFLRYQLVIQWPTFERVLPRTIDPELLLKSDSRVPAALAGGLPQGLKPATYHRFKLHR